MRGDVRDHIVLLKIDHGGVETRRGSVEVQCSFLGRSIFDFCNNIGTYPTWPTYWMSALRHFSDVDIVTNVRFTGRAFGQRRFFPAPDIRGAAHR